MQSGELSAKLSWALYIVPFIFYFLFHNHYDIPNSKCKSSSPHISIGIFLIPYFIILFVCGMPMLFMELAVGQYTGRGPIGAISQLCPLFKGLFNSIICSFSFVHITNWYRTFFSVQFCCTIHTVYLFKWQFVLFFHRVYYYYHWACIVAKCCACNRSWCGKRHRFIPHVNVLQCDYSVCDLLPIFRISAGNAMVRLFSQVCDRRQWFVVYCLSD